MKAFWCWLLHRRYRKFRSKGYVGCWIYECSKCKRSWVVETPYPV